MKYSDLVTLLSEARMSKYNRVTHGDKMKTIQLYHHNLKLSQRLFGVIGMFEVALRNAIHVFGTDVLLGNHNFHKKCHLTGCKMFNTSVPLNYMPNSAIWHIWSKV